MGSFLKSDDAASNDFRTTQLAFTGSLAAAVLAAISCCSEQNIVSGRSCTSPCGGLCADEHSLATTAISSKATTTRKQEDSMKFRPLHDRVVVKRIEAEDKTAGGIIIPDTAKEKPSQGEITAVGPGGRDESGRLIPIDLKVGDRVLFGKWSGTEVKLDGQELLIMKESDIMGVLTELPAAKKKVA
ncbi:co-chaperonin GroES (HSP10) [Bradyrhizobium elkanii]|nr:co-chaperonin GroES (HSP10) [Bradyrhizobium elkanii]MCS3588988.1 co-chaperonin GroES (HSP10) [Bradyrhizobium elkanii]MCW2113378.1 co-chaperonin GroES (HSP10) [Bradyrhizobium elkanii]